MRNKWPFLFFLLPLLMACSSKQKVDLMVYGGSIHSYGPNEFEAECLIIHQGKVLAHGAYDSLSGIYAAAEIINLQGGSLFPAWHDAHTHFAAMGKGLTEIDLRDMPSWEACLDRIKEYVAENPDKQWVLGRGWDQNLWGGVYPTRHLLDSLYPSKFFYLSRVDGHAALVSGNVLAELKFDVETRIAGGDLLVNNRQLSGLLIDAAKDLAFAAVPMPSSDEISQALLAAQEACLPYGLAAITEAGLPIEVIKIIDSLQRTGLLHMKCIAMLSPGEREFAFAENGIFETPLLKVASFKLYADGALGSRGALLKTPYCDHKGKGLLIHQPEYFDSMCKRIYDLGFQANTHCIGDSANRLILETYGRYLKGKNDRRWRIEHAQIMDMQDIHYFADFSVVPSVQPTHATSDMPWAEDRLCSHRMGGAYAYKSLLRAAGSMPLGTDFPVEEINPMLTLLAAVFRTDKKMNPSGGFQISEGLSLKEALKGMTWWPAWAGFKEHQFGSLEVGMDADFVIYQSNIETLAPEKLPDLRPLATYINGVRRWGKLES